MGVGFLEGPNSCSVSAETWICARAAKRMQDSVESSVMSLVAIVYKTVDVSSEGDDCVSSSKKLRRYDRRLRNPASCIPVSLYSMEKLNNFNASHFQPGMSYPGLPRSCDCGGGTSSETDPQKVPMKCHEDIAASRRIVIAPKPYVSRSMIWMMPVSSSSSGYGVHSLSSTQPGELVRAGTVT